MDKEEVMIEMIKEVLPIEYEIAGTPAIRDIMAGTKFQSPMGGAYIDAESALGLIAATITIASQFYEIIAHFYTPDKKSESQDNLSLNSEIKLLLMEAKSSTKLPEEINDKLDKIIAILIEKLKK